MEDGRWRDEKETERGESGGKKGRDIEIGKTDIRREPRAQEIQRERGVEDNQNVERDMEERTESRAEMDRLMNGELEGQGKTKKNPRTRKKNNKKTED